MIYKEKFKIGLKDVWKNSEVSNKEILERVLRDFGINAKVVEIHIGPAVTEYELTVPAGTKVSRIVNINKEIALALAAKDVIIQAPIPGKDVVGIEVPNEQIQTIYLKEILQSLRDLDYNYKNGLIDLQVGLEAILCRYCSVK